MTKLTYVSINVDYGKKKPYLAATTEKTYEAIGHQIIVSVDDFRSLIKEFYEIDSRYKKSRGGR